MSKRMEIMTSINTMWAECEAMGHGYKKCEHTEAFAKLGQALDDDLKQERIARGVQHKQKEFTELGEEMKNNRNHLTTEAVQRMLNLGHTARQIARIMKTTDSTVHNFINKNNLKRKYTRYAR